MKQYCRYCNNMVCGDANYCSVYSECYTDAKLKKANHCLHFEFNEVDALGENPRPYKPREPKQHDGQCKIIFDGGEPDGHNKHT